MRKLLLATTAALGLAVSAGAANATLTYTVWSGATVLDHNAEFPVPTVDLVANFTDPGNPINFQNHNGPAGSNTFANFFSAPVLAEFVAAGGNANASMSTSDTGTDISTFIRITETYNTATPFSGSIDHDDGGTIWVDGNSSTGVGATFICGSAAEASETTQPCSFPSGLHTLTALYTEDNGAPAILVASIPSEVPEPASLALLGSALVGLGVFVRRRKAA